MKGEPHIYLLIYQEIPLFWGFCEKIDFNELIKNCKNVKSYLVIYGTFEMMF